MSQSKWDAEKMLDVYVYDYFVKRNLHATAQKFLDERKISTHPIAIDAPGGFLFEWWSVFWDIYMARVHEKRSNTATSYAEGQNQNQFGFNHWLKSWMQSYHPSSQLQLQQQLMPQAQPTTSVYDLESRKLRTLLQKQSLGFGIDQMNNTGDVLANVQPTAWIGYPVLPCGNVDVPLQQQEYPQSSLLNHQYQNSSIPILSPNRVISSGGPNADGSWPMTFKENYQALQKEASQKRKQPGSASFPAKHLRSADAFGIFPLISSTPATMMLDNNISVPSLPQIGHSSLPLPIPGSDATGPVFSATNGLAQMNVVLDASLADKNESISCYEDVATREMVISKGFTLAELHILPTSPNDVEFCHFSYDGKLLATGGHDKTATFWCTRSLRLKSKLEEHSHSITDARFSPRMPRFATSSADKTVKVWDADNPDYSLRTFTGHSFAVMSLDFHPWKDDLICSCDNNIEIRYWSIKSGRCVGIIKGGSSLMRFQPRAGRFLAAAAKNVVSILDVETQVCTMKLQGHEGTVNTICWDSTGEHLASVSDDLVKVWKIGSSGNAECVNELISAGNKSHACVFHPFHPSAAIIGCSENLELWDIAENKKVTLHAHNKPISCLAASSVNGLIASASHDKCIKIWK